MITVFGSVVLDLVTNVPAFPTPGESVLVESFTLLPGGKGANQALAAKRAGADVRFVGSVGDDDFGRQALENLTCEGVDLSALGRDSSRPTACATVCVAPSGDNQIVIAAGANFATHNDMLHDAWLQPGEILQMQLEIPFDDVWQAIKRAKAAGATTILNAAPFAPVPADILKKLDILNVNEVEAAMLAANHDMASEDLPALAKSLATRFGLTMVITLGGGGVICATATKFLHANALAIEPIDTVGAGDAFAGAFAAALANELDLGNCLQWGIVAGSLACLGAGAQNSLPKKDKIIQHIQEVMVSEETIK
jgi:ribokinase